MSDAKTVVLQNGRVVTLRPNEPLTRDIVSAKRTCKGDQELFPFAITALYVLIDGQPTSLDDVLDMPMSDFEKVSRLLPGVEDFIQAQGK